MPVLLHLDTRDGVHPRFLSPWESAWNLPRQKGAVATEAMGEDLRRTGQGKGNFERRRGYRCKEEDNHPHGLTGDEELTAPVFLLKT